MVSDNMVTLYSTDSKGKIRVWQASAGQKEGIWGIFTRDGLLDGKMKDPSFKASVEKNIGKANFMSFENQAYKMVEQARDKKLKNGYFYTQEEALNDNTFEPMLCPAGMKWHEYKHKAHVKLPYLVSPKLDGARCNMLVKDGKPFSQTRKRREWKNNLHVESALVDFFKLYPSIVLDGELYNHDYKDNFEDLMSILKKAKPTPEQRAFAAENAEYHVYDFYDTECPELTASERQEILLGWFNSILLNESSIVFVPSMVMIGEEMYDEFHENVMDNGYEGSIVRLNTAYDIGKRSKNLLKRKDIDDTECLVTGVIEGTGTMSGMAGKMTIIFDGVEQEAGFAAGWNHDKLKNVLANKEDYIGKMATIEYFGITKYGKARMPKFKAIRDYE